MNADVIIGIIGLILAASGWPAYVWQRRQIESDAKKAIRDNLNELNKLVGKWIDKITEITIVNDELPLSQSFYRTANDIMVFNEVRGGFQNEMYHLLHSLPQGGVFDAIRQKFEEFKDQALDYKDGAITRLTDTPHPPRDIDEWNRSKERGLSYLRKLCDDLQNFLRECSAKYQ